MEPRTPLADFLRARRELVQPEDVGLPAGSRRRVRGLRREEVALLAGISNEYYLRLEQGRDQHPSEQVVDALARALQLDDEGTAHVLELSRARPRRRAGSTTHRPERVPDGVRMLLETVNVPAFVMDRYRDVMAVNRLATALEPALVIGANRMVSLFTDPQARSYHPDWVQNTASVVAQLRADIGADQDDPRFQALVGELSLKSERFRRLWARHDVKAVGSPTGVVNHPVVGELILHREKFAVLGTTSLVVVVYHAEPGTPSAEALAMLASLT
ncbi:helix-turn-helix transcriptional regulator [Kineococcus rhizosphaerae]|uniref:helix-turn-helix transcriptional regulator n=1 Tax=Kineococcus rhizosphaerae TaxID=559628 RepID=UPI000D05F397|nr:helix-turn-helix transcriptional regulator [Kineococcus rhizosphaerae]